MPRNLTGGNKAKSGKNEVGRVAELHEVDESQGQMVGRILRSLGDRNMLIYCNDGKERIAHIRGSLRKKVAKLEVGDIVLISLRGEAMGTTSGSCMDRGDILAKYERDVYRQLKNIEGINPKLFNQLEVMDVKQRASNIVNVVDDCGFDMDGSDEEKEDDQEETIDENGNVLVELTKEERATKKLKEDTKRAMLRNAKEGARNTNNNDDDIDIDAI